MSVPDEFPALVNALEQANANADTWRKRAEEATRRHAVLEQLVLGDSISPAAAEQVRNVRAILGGPGTAAYALQGLAFTAGKEIERLTAQLAAIRGPAACLLATTRASLYVAIEAERARQDKKWGGPDHDDQHGPNDWTAMIVQRMGQALAEEGDFPEHRRRVMQVAALALAWLEVAERAPGRIPAPPFSTSPPTAGEKGPSKP